LPAHVFNGVDVIQCAAVSQCGGLLLNCLDLIGKRQRNLPATLERSDCGQVRRRRSGIRYAAVFLPASARPEKLY